MSEYMAEFESTRYVGHVPHGASTPRSTTMSISTASVRTISPRKAAFRGTRSVAQLSEEGKREWCPTGNGTTQSDITFWNRAIATPSERGRPPTGKSEVQRRTALCRCGASVRGGALRGVASHEGWCAGGVPQAMSRPVPTAQFTRENFWPLAGGNYSPGDHRRCALPRAPLRLARRRTCG